MASSGLLEAGIGLLVTIVTAMTFLLKRQLSKIDESVNHKHKHNRQETLYDLQHSQTLLLEKLTGDMDALVESNQDDHVNLFDRIDRLNRKVDCHCEDEEKHLPKEDIDG